MCNFKIFHAGHELKVVHNKPIENIIKIASHNDHIFMLTRAKQLFFGTYNGNVLQNQIQFELIREDVIDVACSIDSIYVVDGNGCVQHCPQIAFEFDKRWNDIPILNYGAIYEGVISNNNDAVRVMEVSCNNDGALFITADRELYAMGHFNGVCTSDQPIKVERFINYEILQVTMGKQFAVILTRKRSMHTLHSTISHTNHIDSSSCDGSMLSIDAVPSMMATDNDRDSLHSMQTFPESTIDNSNVSLNGSNLSIVKPITNNNTDNESSTPEHSFGFDVEHAIGEILKTSDQIQTQVWCFGSINNDGQLGVGDHFKRTDAVEVESLRDQGVVRICSGDEHTAALTLDARLYLWGDNSNEQISHWLEREYSSSPRRFHKNEQNIFSVQCGQQSTYILTNDFDRYELSRNKYFSTVMVQPEVANNADSMQQHHHYHHYPIDYLFLASKQYLVVNDGWTSLRFEQYLNFEQQFLQDALHNTRPCVESFLRTLNRNINIKHPQLYRQFCQQFKTITELSAKNIATIRNYACYKSDFQAITFIRFHIEYVHVFRRYAKFYCEILCSDDFLASRQVLLPKADFESKFAIPIHHTMNYVNFIQDLLVTHMENELLIAARSNWMKVGCDIDTMLKLANVTRNFWAANLKNIPSTLQQPERRFILDSKNEYPLKLLPSSRFKSNWFILFNDIFCHSTGSSSSLKQYALKTLWVNNVIDKDVSPSSSSTSSTSTSNARKYAFKIITPEDQFLVSAPSNDVKVHWMQSLDRQIKETLGKVHSKSNLLRRTTSYTFSDKHRTFASCKYFGQWALGKMDGIGCIEYADNRVYTGQIKLNSIYGYGRLKASNSTYEGRFVDGHFEGFGQLETHQSNETYDGYFKNGLKHGFGVQQQLDTNRTYIGEFMNGSPSGYGVDDADCGKYMGNFIDGHRNGHGLCITADGTYFEGHFIDNEYLSGSSIAYFSNGSYYVGDLSIRGPNGRGTFYLPGEPIQNDVNIDMNGQTAITVRGSILSGSLGGNWENVKINSGNMLINQIFDKWPSQFGQQQIDCNHKWASLFSDWEHDVFGCPIGEISDTKKVWHQIVDYINIVKQTESLKSTIATSAILYERGSHANKLQSSSSHFMQDFQMSNRHEYHVSKSLSLSRITGKNYKRNLLAVERTKSISNEFLNSAVNFSSDNVATVKADTEQQQQQQQTRESRTDDDRLTMSTALNNAVPCFGISTLDANDLRLVRDYLTKAFKNKYHPLGILNSKISYCFYTSYGGWKVKPISVLSMHAMKEWESISKRIYDIIRKMFPILPQEYGTLDDEFISHRSLLYPIILSENIYSTLFVLYANKCSKRDEIYQQRIKMSEKKTDIELANSLKLSSKYLMLIEDKEFSLAIFTLRQVNEKFCPREMLNLIEQTYKHVELAAETVSKLPKPNNGEDDGANGMNTDSDSKATISDTEMVQLNADNIMPLTIFLLLRATIHHLGTEILLLEDLLGPDFEFVMNGFAGYCFTTIKAAYQHIINESFLQ